MPRATRRRAAFTPHLRTGAPRTHAPEGGQARRRPLRLSLGGDAAPQDVEIVAVVEVVEGHDRTLSRGQDRRKGARPQPLVVRASVRSGCMVRSAAHLRGHYCRGRRWGQLLERDHASGLACRTFTFSVADADKVTIKRPSEGELWAGSSSSSPSASMARTCTLDTRQ